MLLAGGSGTRLGLGRNKVFVDVGSRPVLSWSLATLDADPRVATLVVVARRGDEAMVEAAIDSCRPTTVVRVVEGGASRSASERAAFALLADDVDAGEIDLVVVHDGARPFLSAELLDRVITTAAVHGGAVPGLVPDAAMFVGIDEDRAVRVDPGSLRRVQTPQGFAAGPLLAAYAAAQLDGVEGVDTSEIVARHGGLDVRVVDGDPDNIKVTRPDDLPLADDIAARLGR